MGSDGALVDAIAFENLPDARDASQVAAAYADAGADELHLEFVALERLKSVAVVRIVTGGVAIPTSVRAEFRTIEAAGTLLEAGAARVTIGGEALLDPNFITAVARAFGSAAVLVEVVAGSEEEGWRVRGADGEETEWDAVTWARVAEAQGGGGLIIRSAGRTRAAPFDLDLIQAVRSQVAVPVLAAGEAGSLEDVFDALMTGDADGVLIGSLLHSGHRSVGEVKRFLAEHGLPVRPVGGER